VTCVNEVDSVITGGVEATPAGTPDPRRWAGFSSTPSSRADRSPSVERDGTYGRSVIRRW